MLTDLDLLEQYGAIQTILVDHDPRCQTLKPWLQTQHACTGGYLRLVESKQRSRHSVVGSNQIPHRFCQNCKKYQSPRSTMIYPQDVILFGRITSTGGFVAMPGNALQSCQEVYVRGIGIIRSFSLRVSIYALQQMQWGLGYHGAEPVDARVRLVAFIMTFFLYHMSTCLILL